MNHLRTDLQTKMSEIKNEVRADITDLRHQITALENKMIIKFGIMQVAAIGILATILKIL